MSSGTINLYAKDRGPTGQRGSQLIPYPPGGPWPSAGMLPLIDNKNVFARDFAIVGTDGEIYQAALNKSVTPTTTVWNLLVTLAGPTGPTGPPGATGAQGATGAPGPTGSQGPSGQTGSQGPAGQTGPQGAIGPIGPQGISIQSGAGAPSNTTGNNGDLYLDLTNSILYGPKAAGVWPTPGKSLVGPQGATGPQGPQGPSAPNSGQTIIKMVCIGDSYTDNGNSGFFSAGWNFQTQGENFISNGPCWFSLLSKVYGFAAVPRWNTGGFVGNNYSIASADVDTSPVWGGTAYDMIFQVSTFLSDVSNSIPAGTLISVWIGVNVCRDALSLYLGARDTTDPLGTLSAAFTMPAANGTVTVPQTGGLADSNITVNDGIWIAVAGFMKVTAISGGNITLQNINAAGNAASNTNIPSGGNIRWGVYQYLDAEMVKFVTQINLLTAAGATKILVLNTPNYGQNSSQTGATPTQFSDTVTYWNSILASNMSSISAVTIMDVRTLFDNMTNNPPAFGYLVADLGEASENSAISSLPGWTSDRYKWFDNLHPSAATHRFIAAQAIPIINKLFPASQQLALALQTFASSEPNASILSPGIFVPGGTSLAIGANPFPTEINNTDVRLDYAGRLLDGSLYPLIEWDYQESISASLQVSPCLPVVATYNKVGSAAQGYWGSPQQYNMKGARYFNLIALNDVAGEIYTGLPFITPTSASADSGQMNLDWRITHNLASGDTVLYQFGLMDSLTALANGIYFELTDAAGTITANFVILTAGARVAFSLGTVTWASGGNARNFKAVSDYRWLRWYIYIDGVLTLSTTTLTTTPTAPLFAGHQATKTVLGTGGNQSSFLIDKIRALHLTRLRG